MKMTSSSLSHFHLLDVHHYIDDIMMHEDETEDFGVINFYGKVIDLNNLARNGDGLFENKLNKLSEGLVTQNELLKFVSYLKERSGSKTDSGMYADASKFGDLLPDGWKILLSLRPGVSPPSLYCEKFVSPLKVAFNSCKDVALSLKSQLETNGANPPNEGDMTLVEGDSPVEFDLLHTNPLQNVAAEDEVTYGNPCRDTVLVVDNHQKVVNKKRKRKAKALKNDTSDFQGLGVISINGKEIDLLYLACDASDEFQAKLNKMTEGMRKEAEIMGVLKKLEAQWSSAKKRRKFVEATIFWDAFPENWKILLGLRPRVYPFTLYCCKFISPTGREFDSCKDVAFFLKTQSKEEAMMIREKGRQVGPESVALVPRISTRASELISLGTNDERHVPIQCLIQCNYCTNSFKSIDILESHLQRDHNAIIQSLYTDTLSRKHSVPCGAVILQERKSAVVYKETSTISKRPKKNHMNGEGSSRMPKPMNEHKNNSDPKRDLNSSCVYCFDEFFREPADAEETPWPICPACKKLALNSSDKKHFEVFQHANQ